MICKDDKTKAKNKEYCRKYYESNKAKFIEYRLKAKDKEVARLKEYYNNNKEYVKNKNKEWKENNKEKRRLQNLEYLKNKKLIDPLFKLKTTTRNLIYRALKTGGYSKNLKTVNMLGCSFDEFKLYLESKFESWMNWDNYGNWNGVTKNINVSWDIDHIIPLTTAKTEEEMLVLNHYTNLQPLCSYINRYIKKNKTY